MKLSVLVDNNTYIDRYFLGEPAVSYYIEDGETKILFDAGYSDAFLSNAKKMNIDLEQVGKLVLSHGHIDHTNGLRYYLNRSRELELIGCPDVLAPKEYDTGERFGAPFSEDELKTRCKLHLTASPVRISEHITFLGEIPPAFDFEKRYHIGKVLRNNLFVDDYLYDDSAIVYQNDDGIFVITGCSHSGICSIIEYAKQVCRENRVLGVIGGFHLFENDERTRRTIGYLKENRIGSLYPCHCVSLKVKTEMAKELDIGEVGVGLELEI